MLFLLAFSGVAFLAFVAATAYLYWAEKEFKETKNGFERLPGPRGLPLIGSVHELSMKNNWMKFHEWGEQFGPIFETNLAGVNHVWICRDEVAHDILTKQAAITSDRPHLAAIEADNRTSGHYLPLLSRNAVWSRQRKFTKQAMDQSVGASFYGYPELEALRLLNELLSDRTNYHNSMESFTARVASRLAWESPHAAEELKQRARELLISVSPTGAIVNSLTFLKFLPETLSPWKAWERRRARTEHSFFTTMQQYVANSDENVSPVQSKQSWTRLFLEKRKLWGFSDDKEASFAVGMNTIASALTPSAPMQSFCLALCYHPHFQPFLHEEIDRVCGGRLPTQADMPDMPLMRAFLRETQRWRPSGPYGIPHEATEDIEYNSYYIPKGSAIHALEWSIGRDPEIYPDPEAFNPFRWIDPQYPTYREPLSKYPTITGYSQYGYGNRICGGQPLVEANLFVGCASIAWLFSLGLIGATSNAAPELRTDTPPPEEDVAAFLDRKVDFDKIDELSNSSSVNGNAAAKTQQPDEKNWYQNDPTMDYSTLLIAKPMPFNFDLRVRNVERAEILTREWLRSKVDGKFEDDKAFWTDERGRPSHQGNKDFGWGATYA